MTEIVCRGGGLNQRIAETRFDIGIIIYLEMRPTTMYGEHFDAYGSVAIASLLSCQRQADLSINTSGTI